MASPLPVGEGENTALIALAVLGVSGARSAAGSGEEKDELRKAEGRSLLSMLARLRVDQFVVDESRCQVWQGVRAWHRSKRCPVFDDRTSFGARCG